MVITKHRKETTLSKILLLELQKPEMNLNLVSEEVM